MDLAQNYINKLLYSSNFIIAKVCFQPIIYWKNWQNVDRKYQLITKKCKTIIILVLWKKYIKFSHLFMNPVHDLFNLVQVVYPLLGKQQHTTFFCRLREQQLPQL